MSNSFFSVSPLELPEDTAWRTSDDVPADLRRALEIYGCALDDDVDGQVELVEDIDELGNLYDGIKDQDVIVARDEDDEIIGVASFDFGRKVPFFEGVAVDPAYRGTGVATALGSFVFKKALEQKIGVLHSHSQPSSLAANIRVLQKTGVAFEVDRSGKYPLMIIQLPAA